MHGFVNHVPMHHSPLPYPEMHRARPPGPFGPGGGIDPLAAGLIGAGLGFLGGSLIAGGPGFGFGPGYGPGFGPGPGFGYGPGFGPGPGFWQYGPGFVPYGGF